MPNRKERRKQASKDRKLEKKLVRHITRKLSDPAFQEKYKLSEEDVQRLKKNFAGYEE